MTQTLRELMTPEPATVDAGDHLATVATLMRDKSVGSVAVLRDRKVVGIVTDRDIAIRAVAERSDPWNTSAGDIASGTLVAASPDDTAERAIELMREHAVRRLLVVEDDRPVGIVSLGDLALERDPTSVLADISAAPANR